MSSRADEGPLLPISGQHAYPFELAERVLQRWDEAGAAGHIKVAAPDATHLANVLSICYQATLLREEGRSVTFRLALSEPDVFEPIGGPPTGLHRLVFAAPSPARSTRAPETRARRRVRSVIDRCVSG